MNNQQKITRTIATLGPIGYVPGGGTLASLVTIFVLYITAPLITPCWMPSVMLAIVGISFVIIHYVLVTFNTYDPSEIVLDEVAGSIFALYLFPRTLPWLIAGFVVFRFFDIVKPLGIKRIERIPGAAGIILDDLLAGFYTQATLIISAIIYSLCIGH